MILEIQFDNPEKGPSKVIFNRVWRIEGDIELTSRLIWFMDKIQELTKEYKKRDYVSVEMKKEK